MIRFYSLFVSDDELLASPYIRRFNVFHDLSVHLGKTETLTFLLQTTISPKQHEDINIIFDPLQLNLQKIDVQTFEHQTLITVDLIPKEIGSIRLGFAFPQSDKLHRARTKKIPSPLISVPCIDLKKKHPLNLGKKKGEQVSF
ncbi:MAG: hypothetical protein ACI9BF_000106 [Candidatus Paceibacteria bacterium]|jgi:hypothetical protein